MNVTLLVPGESAGEFGVVYKARLGPRGTFRAMVAVKTLKGFFLKTRV